MSDLYKYFQEEIENKINNQASLEEQRSAYLVDETSIDDLIDDMDDREFLARLKNLCTPKLQYILDQIASGKTLKEIAGDSHELSWLKKVLEHIGRKIGNNIAWYKYLKNLDAQDPDEAFRLRKHCTRTDEINYMRGEYLMTGKTPRKIRGNCPADENDLKSIRIGIFGRTQKF